ncbi:MAG: asparagine synthase (glutamine-hydrolyzing) [Bdellovibrionales bacterium]|jgi:asparagine synthase (glutamine-hydrolysing)|nr:asparagine synthase (glutamine-hydrolyzing) [Bdellovibrionales bacterium]
MCGIAGIIQKRIGETQELRARLEVDLGEMNRKQKHRGPDGEGVFVEEASGKAFGFGHRRLAILDLSPAGHQPMIVKARTGSRLVLTYNGEIYNYLELRSELQAKGYRFNSGTDSEVLLRAYEEWGETCLERFNGMFAFAIYDESRRQIFAARDRFGVKPFYYRETETQFQFASEIKAILGVGRSSGVDDQTVVDYLLTGHLGFSERTFFRDVKELRPGHWLRFDLEQAKWMTGKWYDLGKRVDLLQREIVELVKSEDEAAREVQKVLTDAVRVRLRSDVPVGTCLSGGIDSSSIASIAADLNAGSSFIGITASSLDPQNDETAFAKQVADSRGLDWHCVRPENFLDKLEEVVRLQDEPFGGLSVFMQEAVMAKAKELGVPVLLDGQGGDEVFLGYPKYLQGVGGFRPRLIAKRLASQFGVMEKRELETELFRTRPNEVKEAKAHLLRYRRNLSDPRQAQIMDITETNLPQLLRYEDRNSMHHSIETRLPFLDYRLVELGVALPAGFKIDSGGLQKVVLRNAMLDVVPAGILDRHDKVGFAPPDRVWSRDFKRLWLDRVFNSRFVGALLGQGQIGRASDLVSPDVQWRLINLSIWARLFDVD